MMVLAEIILPLAVRSNYSYRVKPEQVVQMAVGKRVHVPLGKNKIYTGVVKRVWEEKNIPNPEKLRYIEEVVDEYPIVFDAQFQMIEWMAFYYMCTEGEILKAGLPVGLKPKSNQFVRLRMLDLSWEEIVTDDREYLLFEALSTNPEISISEIAEIWDVQNPLSRLKKIEERGWIEIFHKVENTYQAKTKTYLTLAPLYAENEALLNKGLDNLSRAPQQENLLLHVLAMQMQGQLIPKSETLKTLNISSAVVSTLVEKGFLVEQKIEIDRLPNTPSSQPMSAFALNEAQQKCFDTIHASFQQNPEKPILLHGITGSGKTLIYVYLIREAIKKGQQVLYLLPEISITQQIIERVKREIGSRVGVYHSRFNNNERVEIWQKICNKQYDVVIGVRSAIFLPFENLGLIIVDEEHDRSFKQEEPAPRYHARDVAIWLGHTFRCPVLLGSATPSFETFTHALNGKFGMVSLTQRAIDAQLPDLAIIDMRQMQKEKQIRGVFSTPMLEAIQQTLMRGEQVILFQNRRGYSPYLICMHCGHVPECVNCDISLTYHKYKDYARCHYCGHTEYLQDKCPTCGNFTLKKQGVGTERIEEEIKEHFPSMVVERMDLDTTRGKLKFQRLIARLESKEINILVGTQMVSKGLDFENVTLVGVVNADNLLTYPDFRVYEYAYQMLTQVSGRAGRSTKKGKVLIQTLQPQNQVLTALNGSYAEFYEATIKPREELQYPPFARLLRIEIHHPEQQYIEAEALRLNALFKPIFGDNLLGPDYTSVPRIRNLYRMQFLLKIHKTYSLKKVRQAITEAIDMYYQQAPNKTLRILLNVDPM